MKTRGQESPDEAERPAPAGSVPGWPWRCGGGQGTARPTLIATLLLVVLVPSVHAQSYTIDWYKVSGGGGTSSNGQYSVSGTVGQPDASGAMSGGQYSVTGGFWSLISVVQTAGAPVLSITLTAPNTAMISWPSPSTGFSLQVNTSLATANQGNWTTPPQSVTDNGTIKHILVTLPAGSGFYRLKSP